VQELQGVRGIGRKTAARIRAFLGGAAGVND
jgi:hypothetical protein